MKTYLHQSVQFIFNHVNGQFDESESEVSYLITHFDRVIYIFPRASSLFYVPTELERLLLRARQTIVTVGVDERALQKLLSEFPGCRGRLVIDTCIA